MYEVFPLLAGVAAALGVQRLVSPGFRRLSLFGVSVVLGLIAAVISGELFENPIFLFIDIAFVLLAAGVTTLVVVWWQGRPERLS